MANNKPICLRAIPLVLLGGAGFFSAAAMATTCPSAISSYNSYAGNAAQQELIRSSHPECFGSSSNVAQAAASVKGTSITTMQAVSSALGARMIGSSLPSGLAANSNVQTGLAGGNTSSNWNVWGSLSNTSQKYDRGTFNYNGADRTNKFDTSVQNIVIGADYPVGQNLIVGATVAVDNGSGSLSSYTIAAPTGSKSLSTSGNSFAPYLGWQISKDMAADFSLGWGKGKSTVDSSIKTDSTRFFYGANLNYTTWSGNWQMSGKAGYSYGQEKNSDSVNNGATMANTAVTNDVAQIKVAGQAAYWMNGFMPYVGVSYSTDSRGGNATADQKAATEIGNSAWLWSLGMNFISLKSGVTGGIAYEAESGRSRSSSNRWLANVNFRF